MTKRTSQGLTFAAEILKDALQGIEKERERCAGQANSCPEFSHSRDSFEGQVNGLSWALGYLEGLRDFHMRPLTRPAAHSPT